MHLRFSVLPSLNSTVQAPSESAASAASTTTPLTTVAQCSVSTTGNAAGTAPNNLADDLAAMRKTLPAGSVARPVSRWLGPLRRRFPQHHIYRGVKYWEKGFEEIQFLVDNFVDWRSKPEVVSLVQDSALFVQDLMEVRQRLDLEECRDLKRGMRTFMVRAESSSQNAQTEALQKIVAMAVRANLPSSSGSVLSRVSSSRSRLPSPLSSQIESTMPAGGPPLVPTLTAAPVPDSRGPQEASLSYAQVTVEEACDDVQPESIDAAAENSIEMAVFTATAAWVEETVNSLASGSKDLQRPRAIRRVSSMPNL